MGPLLSPLSPLSVQERRKGEIEVVTTEDGRGRGFTVLGLPIRGMFYGQERLCRKVLFSSIHNSRKGESVR